VQIFGNFFSLPLNITFILQNALRVDLFFEATQSQPLLFVSVSVSSTKNSNFLDLSSQSGAHCPIPTRPQVSLHIADNLLAGLGLTITFVEQNFLRFDGFFEASQPQVPSIFIFPFPSKSISNFFLSLSVQDTGSGVSVGLSVGPGVGDGVGPGVGESLGGTDGKKEPLGGADGVAVGPGVGDAGSRVGSGLSVGPGVGDGVGPGVGDGVGPGVGEPLGGTDGKPLGEADGVAVGA